VPTLGEDEATGNIRTALAAWLAFIMYVTAQHHKVLNDFDEKELRPYQTAAAEAGKAWAVAMQKHAPCSARWQYVHRAFAHVEEDIAANGHRDATDDSVIEKGHKNALKRRGQIFQGGTNEGTKVRRTMVTENEHGGMTRQQSQPAALPPGKSTQLHVLAHAAPELAMQRPERAPRGSRSKQPLQGISKVKSQMQLAKERRDAGRSRVVDGLEARLA